jgi:glycosyltransferase involved in cell wall biosynthesis
MFEGIVFLQYGDYKSAITNLNSGGSEQYYAQAHSVNYVASLTEEFRQVTVICLVEDYVYQQMENGVGVIGINIAKHGVNKVLKFLSGVEISHIVLRTPMSSILFFAIRRKIKILPILADSFFCTGLIDRIKLYFLAKNLNHSHIKCIGNHNTNSCYSLSEIGVKSSKIVPWDWPHFTTPDMFPVKSKPSHDCNIFYAGLISKEKGVYDLVEALALFKKKKINLQIAGNDKQGSLRKFVIQKGLQDNIVLLGHIPQSAVVKKMSEADIVVVPSRHDYPEGLPMTIYEGLASRTPLVVSDHKMFTNKVVNKVSGLIFKAGSPQSLADACLALFDDDRLYNQISKNSAQAWYELKIKVEWSELINLFIKEEISSEKLNQISILSYRESDV